MDATALEESKQVGPHVEFVGSCSPCTWTDIMNFRSLFAGADRRLRQRQVFIHVRGGESISRSCQRPIAVSAPPEAAATAGLREICVFVRAYDRNSEGEGWSS